MPRIFNLSCSSCKAWVLSYRKEGPGNLLRLYLDRIIEPETLARLKELTHKSNLPSLSCSGCGQLIGVPMIHHSRLAYRLVKGSFRKEKEG